MLRRREVKEIYKTEKFINSEELTISFSLPAHDWRLLQESKLWEHLDNYLKFVKIQIARCASERRKRY